MNCFINFQKMQPQVEKENKAAGTRACKASLPELGKLLKPALRRVTEASEANFTLVSTV